MRRRADIKTGYDCNSNCLFCVIGDKLFSGDRSTADVLDELRASRATCDDVVFTGAEVTIRPDFFTLLAAARGYGYTTVQVQTNGRMLAHPEFCRRAVAAGANEFSPAIHGHTAKIHDALTRAPGSFEQVVAAIRHLRALGQRIVTNTVIARQNTSHLPALASLLIELGVDQFQLAFPHPTGHAATHFRSVVPRISEAAPFVHEALRLGNAAGVACMAEAMPYCTMPGLEPQVAELHIPPTEIVYDGYVVPDYATDRMNRGKVRFAECASCRFEPICEGPWREYPERLGSAEFQPVTGPRVVDTEVVLDDRFDMLGCPAPALQDGRARRGWTAVVFYAEDGSPTCTSELCSLRDGSRELDARGIEVIAIAPDGVDRHLAFARAHGFGFALLSDPELALARAWRATTAGAIRRSTYLVDPAGQVAHVIVRVDAPHHATQIASAFDRLHGPARPLEAGHELVVLRRGPTRPSPQVIQ